MPRKYKHSHLPKLPDHGSPFLRSVFKAIRDWCEENDTTQDDLAEIAGISAPAMSRWKNRRGHSNPNLFHLEAVLEAMGYELKLQKIDQKKVSDQQYTDVSRETMGAV